MAHHKHIGPVGPAFGDWEFYRGCVHERAESLPPFPHLSAAWSKIEHEIHAMFSLDNPFAHTEALIRIAALCERTAVDITIPNARVTKSKSKPRRNRREEILTKKGPRQ